jgi:hypothetical protein
VLQKGISRHVIAHKRFPDLIEKSVKKKKKKKKKKENTESANAFSIGNMLHFKMAEPTLIIFNDRRSARTNATLEIRWNSCI